MTLQQVTRTYLQMTSPSQHTRAAALDMPVRVAKIDDCTVSFYRDLYTKVGEPYHWVDRLTWSDDQVAAHIHSKDASIWMMHYNDAVAGYFELQKHRDRSVEIPYFGLLPEYLGRGLGKFLLSYAVDRAWDFGANRVWLHTCTLDNPAALPNYLKRGFEPYKQETYMVEL